MPHGYSREIEEDNEAATIMLSDARGILPGTIQVSLSYWGHTAFDNSFGNMTFLDFASAILCLFSLAMHG